jgi:HK97 family phage portal protein
MYSKEFKQQAVTLFESSGKKHVQVARELGVSSSSLSRWRKEFGTHASNSSTISVPPVILHPLTSPTYETHVGVINIEEAHKRSAKYKGPQNLSMAWDDSYTGVSSTQVRDGLLTERDKKDTYYKAYIGNPWVRACVQAIAKRFTSGKWEIEEIEQGKGNQANYDKLKQFFLFINPDEDFKQLLRSIAEDLGIYGESFVEVVYGPDGLPAQLHKIDCISMSVRFDQHGMVTKYMQDLDKSTDTVEFEPDQIIRWWLPDPRANKKALSPIECMKDSVFLYQSMITWGEKFFKQGARPGFAIEMGPDSQIDDGNRYIKFFKENYMGIQNAHVPPVVYGGAKIQEFGKGSVELDFLKSLAWARDEILAGYNVPLSVTGIQEAAHLGGGTGDSANKIFVLNTVKPIEEMILEKLNYRIVQKSFRITDHMVTVQHGDYRTDESVTASSDKQIRNGSLTINEARSERGRPPVEGGDESVIVASRDIVPVARLQDLSEEQKEQTQLSIQSAQQALKNAKSAPTQEENPQRNILSKNSPSEDEKEQNLPTNKESWTQEMIDLILNQSLQDMEEDELLENDEDEELPLSEETEATL